MAMKSGNLLIKVTVLIAIAAAVFFALNSLRKPSDTDQGQAPETAVPVEGAAPAAPHGALSREEAERIGTEIGTRIGTEIGTQIGREVAAQMLAERQAELATASKPAEPESASPPAVEEPAPPVETASAEPVVAPASKPARQEKRTQGSIPGTPIAQPMTGRDPWWIKSNTGDADALVMTYAGNLKSSDGKQSGIALMFSGRFDNQTDFASFISVSGDGASGEWRLGVNRGLVYMANVPSGSYTVTVKAGFKDADGKTLKTEVSGTVDVQ